MITKQKNKKVLVGIIAAAVLILGIVCGSITLAGNTLERRMEKYLDLGDKYLSELDYEQALVAYQQVLEIEPKNLNAYKGALLACEGLGDKDGMESLYDDALDVIEGLKKRERKQVYDTVVGIYLYADAVYPGDHEAAARVLERGFDTLGGDERIIRALIKEYGILAGNYIEAGIYEKEQQIYKKIVEKKLENADALSGWEQRVRERFQNYLSKNGGTDNAPESTPEPTAEPTAEPTPIPTAEHMPEPTSTPAPEPTLVPFVQKGAVKDSGQYKGLNWLVTDAGELVVTGHMEGEGLDSESIWLEAPWKQYQDETSVVYMSFTGAKSLRYLFGARKTSWGMEYLVGSDVLSEVNVSGLDTSSVTDMSGMFYECGSLSRVDLSGFDTSNVTDMSGMFGGCESLGSVDVSGFDTSSVTDMSAMFCACYSLSSVDLSSFDTSNVTDMGGMFEVCGSLSSVDLSSFDTGSVTDMSCMFEGCISLGSVDLSSFDTSSVTNMGEMFYGCESLSSVDLSSFNTSSVTDMYGMFGDCSNLQEILVGDGWRVPADPYANGMFDGCDVSSVTHK